MKRLLVAVVLLLCLGSVALADSIWYCPQCGAKCNANFCPYDGTSRPVAMQPQRTSVSVGQKVYLGTYEQDGNYRNGAEPILWRVLDVRGGQALLISEYGIELHLIHPFSKTVTWATCEMRSWLNGTFYNAAFSAQEQRAILETLIPNDQSTGYPFSAKDNPQYCAATYDRVFLLSWQETQRYFSSNADRRCVPTRAAQMQGAKVMSNGYGWWWTRSPGYTYNMWLAINSQGTRVPGDQHVHNSNNNTGMVRPAIWVDASLIGSW